MTSVLTKNPIRPSSSGSDSAGDRRPDGEVFLPRVAVQKHLERRQQRHVQRRAFVSDRVLAPLREWSSAKLSTVSPPRWLGNRWPGSVRGQFEIGHARELFRPVTELGVEDRALEPVSLPDRVVGVLDREFG